MEWDPNAFMLTKLLLGSLTVQCYVQEILKPAEIPFLSLQPFFQQHIAAVPRACLRLVEILLEPSFSSDMFPIENVLDIVRRDDITPSVPQKLLPWFKYN
ncbi:hypothetical protein TNCV_3329931 [Trichonephila clavipes]|nr:hypothetical protein TNCV_3329931 [Trichonephila clavipes]